MNRRKAKGREERRVECRTKGGKKSIYIYIYIYIYVKLVSITLFMRNCVTMATDSPVLSLV